MKIVVDDKIPWILPPLHQLADEVVALPGQAISAEDVRDAYILIVRTRTKCDRALLAGSSVRLVVTATIGYDHLDTAYLEEAGIEWRNCPGCNATSVAQYVRSALILLQRERGMIPSQSVLGIVGVGHVGSAVLEAVRPMGFRRIMLCDPPREARGDIAPYRPGWSRMPDIAREADIITFHTPLTREGDSPTWHLLDERMLCRLVKKPFIINTSRGEVVDNKAMVRALSDGRVRDAVIDTWENEPHICTTLLDKAFIGTPHIAGYSADGKANATRMSLEAVCDCLGRPMTFDIQPPSLPDTCSLRQVPPRKAATLDGAMTDEAADLALFLYNPHADCERLRRNPEAFEWLRGHYPLRRERLT